MKTNQKFGTIDNAALTTVFGGAARVAASSKNSDMDSKLTLMLTQIADSIKDAKTNQGGMDQMMPMMMMMMMMGGGGGGGGAQVAAPPPPPPPAPAGGTFVKVNVR